MSEPSNATIWLVLWSQPILFNRRLVRCFNYVMPLWSAVDYYQHLSVRRKAWNTPSLVTDWNQRFDQKQQWMSVTFMTWQSVWQQGRGKVKQFNRNSIQPNQPLQNPANATIWLVLWSQPIWFNRRLVRCFNYVTPLWSAVDYYQHLSIRRKAWNTPSLVTDWNQVWSKTAVDVNDIHDKDKMYDCMQQRKGRRWQVGSWHRIGQGCVVNSEEVTI